MGEDGREEFYQVAEREDANSRILHRARRVSHLISSGRNSYVLGLLFQGVIQVKGVKK